MTHRLVGSKVPYPEHLRPVGSSDVLPLPNQPHVWRRRREQQRDTKARPGFYVGNISDPQLVGFINPKSRLTRSEALSSVIDRCVVRMPFLRLTHIYWLVASACNTLTAGVNTYFAQILKDTRCAIGPIGTLMKGSYLFCQLSSAFALWDKGR